TPTIGNHVSLELQASLVGCIHVKTSRRTKALTDEEAIARWLITQVAQGNAVLFLGAGASLASQTTDGQMAPDARRLARSISDEFIHEYYDWPLATSAAYAEAMVGRTQVEVFVRDLFRNLVPSNGLRVLTQMPWKSIYTTNF